MPPSPPDDFPPAPAVRAQQDKKKLGIGGCLIAAVVVVALLILIPAIAYQFWNRAAAQRVEAHLAGIRQLGEPVSGSEMLASYQTPDEDATEFWLVAFGELENPSFEAAARALPIVGESDDPIPAPGQPWAQQAEVVAFLETFAAPLDSLHTAAEMGGSARYPLHFQGIATLLPHVETARTAARMLSLEFHLRLREGNTAAATRSLRTLFRLGRSLENEPILISQLVQVAIHQMGLELVRKHVPLANFADDEVEMLQNEIREIDVKQSFVLAQQGERVFGISAFTNQEEMAAIVGGSGAASRLLGSNEDFAFYLETMTNVVEAVKKPWPEAMAASTESAELIEARTKTWLERLRYPVTAMLVPAVEAALSAAAQGHAACQLTDAALAIERFQRSHGALPPSWDDLVPEFLPAVPLDPFDDAARPLRFRRDEESLRIYSIGRDRVDDGGDFDGDFWETPDLLYRRRANLAPQK